MTARDTYAAAQESNRHPDIGWRRRALAMSKWKFVFNSNFRRLPIARKSLPENKTHSPSGQA
jgi:hypothetical protein